MPSRTPFNHGDNIVSWFASRTTGTSIGCESKLEYDYLHLVDFDPTVVDIEEQPFPIGYEHEGKRRRYTPDFLLRLQGGEQILVECKPASQVDRAENQRAFAAARAWCEAHGYAFLVVTDAELRRGCRLENLKWLAQFRERDGLAPEIAARLLTLLASAAGPLPLGQLAAALRHDAPEATVVQHLCHLVYHHRIIVPLDDARITRDTPAWLPERQPT